MSQCVHSHWSQQKGMEVGILNETESDKNVKTHFSQPEDKKLK